MQKSISKPDQLQGAEKWEHSNTAGESIHGHKQNNFVEGTLVFKLLEGK